MPRYTINITRPRIGGVGIGGGGAGGGSPAYPPQPPPPPPPDPTPGTGRVTVSGNKLLDGDGNQLFLAGVHFNPNWTVSGSVPNGDRHTQEAGWVDLKAAGANFMLIALNSELWTNDPDSDDYKSYIDTYVNWCRTYNLYYIFKLHHVGNPGDSYCGPGTNYKITIPAGAAYKARAIEMWEDLATLYKDDLNYCGLHILNEPYGGNDYTYWDDVVDYYNEVIDIITIIDPDCIFWVMEPYNWGSFNHHWNSPGNPYRGYLANPNVVYDFHSYYHFAIIAGDAWALAYQAGNIALGDALLRTWYEEIALPPQDDGHPVYCGEFSIHGTDDNFCWVGADCDDGECDGRSINANYEDAHIGQMDVFYERDIHYTDFVLSALISNNWALRSCDGLSWSERGEILRDNLPAGLTKPPDV